MGPRAAPPPARRTPAVPRHRIAAHRCCRWPRRRAQSGLPPARRTPAILRHRIAAHRCCRWPRRRACRPPCPGPAPAWRLGGCGYTGGTNRRRVAYRPAPAPPSTRRVTYAPCAEISRPTRGQRNMHRRAARCQHTRSCGDERVTRRRRPPPPRPSHRGRRGSAPLRRAPARASAARRSHDPPSSVSAGSPTPTRDSRGAPAS